MIKATGHAVSDTLSLRARRRLFTGEGHYARETQDMVAFSHLLPRGALMTKPPRLDVPRALFRSAGQGGNVAQLPFASTAPFPGGGQHRNDTQSRVAAAHPFRRFWLPLKLRQQRRIYRGLNNDRLYRFYPRRWPDLD